MESVKLTPIAVYPFTRSSIYLYSSSLSSFSRYGKFEERGRRKKNRFCAILSPCKFLLIELFASWNGWRDTWRCFRSVNFRLNGNTCRSQISKLPVEKAAFRIAANSPRQEDPALVRGKVASFREKVLSKNEGRVHKLHRFELTNIFYILTFPNIDGELHKGPVGTSKFFAETPF